MLFSHLHANKKVGSYVIDNHNYSKLHVIFCLMICLDFAQMIVRNYLLWEYVIISRERQCLTLNLDDQSSFEPRCEKTGLRGFRPGPTQTGLYNHKRWLEA